MGEQQRLDRLNESALDLVRTMAMEKAIDLSDPMVMKLINLGIRAGSIATFELIMADIKNKEH